MSQTIALKMVQASLATAMSYLSVVWGIASGYLVFSEVIFCAAAWLARLVHKCSVTPVGPISRTHMISAMQVPNLLSLGGALLVCSCTLVLGLAEHKSAGRQFCWLHQVPTSAQNYSASIWQRYMGKSAMYDRIATEELDPSCISEPEQLR